MDSMRKLILDQEEAERPLCDQVRRGLLEAIGLLADAANHPLIARQQIYDAHEHIKEAFKAALKLDPIEEEPKEWHPRERPNPRTEDERLDDPIHGQAESLNAETRMSRGQW